MNSETWKEFERFAAWFIGGKRYPANIGGRVDVESDTALAQAKKVRNLSHSLLTSLADEMAILGKARGKIGLVIHQVPKGRGKQGIPLVTMTCEHFDEWFCLRKDNQQEINRNWSKRFDEVSKHLGLTPSPDSPGERRIIKRLNPIRESSEEEETIHDEFTKKLLKRAPYPYGKSSEEE